MLREAWEIEHVIAWELTRDDGDDNLKPAHIDCHKQKTHGHDRPVINEAKRREAKHTGVKRPSSSLATKDKRAPKRLTKQLPPRVRDVFGYAGTGKTTLARPKPERQHPPKLPVPGRRPIYAQKDTSHV